MRDFRKYDLTSFRKDLEELHIHLTEEQEERFLSFYELLVEWNEVMNLTAITEFDEVIKKHFVDSLSFVKAVPELEEKFLSGKAGVIVGKLVEPFGHIVVDLVKGGGGDF